MIKLIGDKVLLRKLKQLGDSAADAMEEAVLAGAEIVKDEASRRAPRRTGNLARNILAEVGEKSSTQVMVKVGPNKDAFYGMFVELGTVKMPAQPFLFPALEAKQREVRSEIRKALRKAIREAVR